MTVSCPWSLYVRALDSLNLNLNSPIPACKTSSYVVSCIWWTTVRALGARWKHFAWLTLHSDPIFVFRCHCVLGAKGDWYYSKVMFTLLSTVPELYCAYCASVYFISFSHGYSAILAAKLMIKLDLTWLDLFELFGNCNIDLIFWGTVYNTTWC